MADKRDDQKSNKNYIAKLCLLNKATVKVDPTHLDRSTMAPLGVHPSVVVMRKILCKSFLIAEEAPSRAETSVQRLLEVRQQKLRTLYMNDFLQEDKELREVGLAFYNTQQ